MIECFSLVSYKLTNICCNKVGHLTSTFIFKVKKPGIVLVPGFFYDMMGRYETAHI